MTAAELAHIRGQYQLGNVPLGNAGALLDEVDRLKAEVMELRGWQTSARQQIEDMRRDREGFVVLEVLGKALHSRGDS